MSAVNPALSTPAPPPPAPPDPRAVAALAAGLDLGDPLALLAFGREVQERVARSADILLREVVAQPAGEDVPALVADLRAAISDLDPATFADAGRFFLFNLGRRSLRGAQAAFTAAAERIDAIAIALSRQAGGLKRQVGLLEELMTREAENLAALDLHLAAGHQCLAAARAGKPPAAGDPGQRALLQGLDQLERQLDGLQRSRAIASMTLVQLGIIRSGHLTLAGQIATALNAGLPAWRHRLAGVLALSQQREAEATLRAVAAASPDLAALPVADRTAAAAAHRALLAALETLDAASRQERTALAEAAAALRRHGEPLRLNLP